jgi:BMFP domain-containing protein YqiC
MAEPADGNRIFDVVEELLTELPGRIRGSRSRFSAQAHSVFRAVAEELDLITRDDYEELELRVAQLEHRLRLLENAKDSRESPELP